MVLGTLAIHLVLVPMMYYGLLYLTEQNFKSRFIDQVRYNSFLYSNLMKQAVYENNISKQVDLLNEILIQGDVIYAEFISNGKVLKPDISDNKTVYNFKEDFEFGSHDDDVYFIALDVLGMEDRRHLGTIRLGYDEKNVNRQINSASFYGFLIALGYFMLSITLVIYFGRSLVKPISKLRSLSRSIAAGDKNVSMNINTGIAEVKYLASDLEVMRNILISRHHDIANRENRLRAILDNAGEGIVSSNEFGQILSFNKASENIFGYTESEVLGMNLTVLMPSPYKEQHSKYIEEYNKTGKSKIIGTGRRLHAMHKSGRLIPIYLNVSKVTHNGEITFIGIVHDLSKEVELESKLSQFLNAIQQSPVSIMITDTDGLISYVNPFFSKTTGYSEQEVIGKKASILKSDETEGAVYKELWDTITNGGIWRGILQNRRKNGELFWESATICPVFDNEQNITSYIALKEDITEQRVKDMMLQQAMKLEIVGKMTDGIAHDFNNLLTIIQGNLQFLKEELKTNDNDDNLLLINDAYSAARDGSNMIKQLLTFSRHKNAETESVNIKLFLQKLERLLKRTIPENVVLKVIIPDKDYIIYVDPLQLESALLNLVVNARDAMPNGGTLEISANYLFLKNPFQVERGYLNQGRYISIRIVDTGIGIRDEIRHKVLDPFFSTKTSTTGTGLGLSMVHDFVLQSSGGLAITSRHGKGTMVELILPEYEITEELDVFEEKQLSKPRGGNESILVVEDRENVRRYACRALESLGYKVHVAKDANEAIEFFGSGKHIDLLFSDIVMPGEINGRQLANIINSKYKEIKILLTTGMETNYDKPSEKDKNFLVLYKPYTIEKLARYVRRSIKEHNVN